MIKLHLAVFDVLQAAIGEVDATLGSRRTRDCDLGGDYLDKRDATRTVNRLVRRLRDLGVSVEVASVGAS